MKGILPPVAICGAVLILLASAFAISSTVVGTCTQGSADELEIGGIIAALGYVIGIPLIVWKPARGIGWLVLSPAIVAVGYQSFLAISFFLAYHLHELSACSWKDGTAGFEKDGREPFLTALWIGVSAFGMTGLSVAALRARRCSRRN